MYIFYVHKLNYKRKALAVLRGAKASLGVASFDCYSDFSCGPDPDSGCHKVAV